MRVVTILINLLFFAPSTFGQNIVLNPSFEFSISPWGSVKTVDFFYPSLPYQGYNGTADAPVTPGFVGLRFNHAYPYDFEHNWQEYIYQKLLWQMNEGITYKVTLKYSLSDASQQTTDDFGIAFSSDNFFHENTEEKLRQTIPQIKNKENNFITNYTGWNDFTGYYTADGNEKYFAIGAFKMDSSIELIDVPNNYPYKMLDVFIFIDDVTITACSDYPRVNLIEDTVFCQPGSVTLNATYPGATYLWNTGSTDSIIEVQAIDDEEIFWVDITKDGCTYGDTVRIDLFSTSNDLGENKVVCENNGFVYPVIVDKSDNENLIWEDGSDKAERYIDRVGTFFVTKSQGECEWSDTISVFNFQDYVTLFPNPVIDEFHIVNENENKINIDRIYSEQGELIWQANLSNITVNESIMNLDPAMYLIIVKGYGCEKVIKFEKSPH